MLTDVCISEHPKVAKQSTQQLFGSYRREFIYFLEDNIIIICVVVSELK